MIADNLVVTFWVELAFCASVLYFVRRARLGQRMPPIRRLPGLDAMDEAIGRATESGGAVHFNTGIGDIKNSQTVAALIALEYVGRACARYSTRLICTNRDVIVHSIMDEVLKQAYSVEGKAEELVSEDIRYLSSDQFALAAGVSGLLQREKITTNILLGAFWAESLIIAEVAAAKGIIQISGTANTHQIPFFVAACDYCLIGEEIYAASAYLSGSPVLLGTIVCQDVFKAIAIVILLIGSLITTVVGPSLKQFLVR